MLLSYYVRSRRSNFAGKEKKEKENQKKIKEKNK